VYHSLEHLLLCRLAHVDVISWRSDCRNGGAGLIDDIT
jgi:hypothetical protein